MAPLETLLLNYAKVDDWFLFGIIILIVSLYLKNLNMKIIYLAEASLIERLCYDIINKKRKDEILQNIDGYKDTISQMYEIKSTQLPKTNNEYIRTAALICLKNLPNLSQLTSLDLLPYMCEKRKEKNKKSKLKDGLYIFRRFFLALIFLIIVIISFDILLGLEYPFAGLDLLQSVILIGIFLLFSVICALLCTVADKVSSAYNKVIYIDCLNKIQLKNK